MDFDVDKILYSSLKCRIKPSLKISSFVPKKDVVTLCGRVSELLNKENILIHLEPPLHVVGDLHGNVTDLLRILQTIGYPPHEKYLFLGDYVDRGHDSVEVLLILFCLKVKFPNDIYLLRGNHETQLMSTFYGFKDEIINKYSKSLFYEFHRVFNLMPLTALIQKKIFCVHGGLSPLFKSFTHLQKLEKPTDIDQPSMFLDFIWSDPKDGPTKFVPSNRRSGNYFNADALKAFLKKTGCELVLRAHEYCVHGYNFPYEKVDGCITVFSSSNYCDRMNKAAAINVSKTLEVTLTSFDPLSEKNTFTMTFPEWLGQKMIEELIKERDSISEPSSELGGAKTAGVSLEATLDADTVKALC